MEQRSVKWQGNKLHSFVLTCLPGPHCCPLLLEVLLGSPGQTGQHHPWVWRKSQWASAELEPWITACPRQRGRTEARLWPERCPVQNQNSPTTNVTEKFKLNSVFRGFQALWIGMYRYDKSKNINSFSTSLNWISITEWHKLKVQFIAGKYFLPLCWKCFFKYFYTNIDISEENKFIFIILRIEVKIVILWWVFLKSKFSSCKICGSKQVSFSWT